jgi:hypothetical protein
MSEVAAKREGTNDVLSSPARNAKGAEHDF